MSYDTYTYVGNNMKIPFIILTLCFGIINSQNLKCIDIELYQSDNDLVQIKNNLAETESKINTLQLIVLPNSIAEFTRWTNYKRKGFNYGFSVLLINNTTNDYNLSNRDGKVIIRRQVFYNGEWIPVRSFDRTPKPICGNSYSSDKIIKAYSSFLFVAPCLEGNIKAKFRFVVMTKNENPNSLIISNEFDGFISEKLIK